MHPSFPYESSRSRGGDYGSGVGGVRGRGDVLVQSHPGLEDSLVLHNALSSVVEEAQVSRARTVVYYFFFYFLSPTSRRRSADDTDGERRSGTLFAGLFSTYFALPVQYYGIQKMDASRLLLLKRSRNRYRVLESCWGTGGGDYGGLNVYGCTRFRTTAAITGPVRFAAS